MTEPVFIIGVAPRSGTNYVEDLLCVHEDCGLAIPLREDHLLSQADHLKRYVDRVTTSWLRRGRWGFQPGHTDDLFRGLGAGLIDFLVSQVDERRRITEPPAGLPGIEASFKLAPRYLITKTPRPTNLDLFPRLFPDSKLIILMRDGRAVAESSMRSWGWPFDTAVSSWKQGAAEIADFLDKNPEGDHFFIRYEDLIDQPEHALDGIFRFLELDPGRYDWERGLNRPVRGSSSFKEQGSAGVVSWSPMTKTSAFDPNARYAAWTSRQHARFNHMAGDLLSRFGYERKDTPSRPGDRAMELALDIRTWVRSRLAPLVHRARQRAKSIPLSQ